MPLANQIFGDLITLTPSIKGGHLYWNCKCFCGNTKLIRDTHLRDGKSTSCGLCNHKLYHPYAHKSWDSMLQRCCNPNAPDYSRYGGRGIEVCLSWKLRFTNFLKEMGDPPSCSITGKRYTLERLDNDGHYTKENCVWADVYTQANNRQTSIHPAIKALHKSKPFRMS